MADARVPFTLDQAASLNAYQASGSFHPFTCGNDLCPGTGGEHAVLVAGEDGWHCPACTYTQDWAHEAMADWQWKEFTGITVSVDGGAPIQGVVASRDEPDAYPPVTG